MDLTLMDFDLFASGCTMWTEIIVTPRRTQWHLPPQCRHNISIPNKCLIKKKLNLFYALIK